MKKYKYIIYAAVLTFFAIKIIILQHKNTKLEEKIYPTTIDTVQVLMTIRDTSFVHTAVVHKSTDTVLVHSAAYDMNVYSDRVQHPLFDLDVKFDPQPKAFSYDFHFRPVSLNLIFHDKHDLRKGFELKVVPPVFATNVDWGDYKPQKKIHGLSCGIGLGYSKESGPLIIGGIRFKKNEVGILLREQSYGLFFQRTIFEY